MDHFLNSDAVRFFSGSAHPGKILRRTDLQRHSKIVVKGGVIRFIAQNLMAISVHGDEGTGVALGN